MGIKKLIYEILTGVIIMSNTGCGNVVSHEKLAIRLLNEKYSESFEIESVQSQSFSGGYYTVIAYQEEEPELLFRAEINSDGTGLSDNYVTKILCRDMAEQVARNLNNLPGIYYIYVEVMFEPMGLSKKGITLKEFMEEMPMNEFIIHVNYVPEDGTSEEIYQGLGNILQNMEGITGRVQLYIMEETDLLWVQDYLETHDRGYGNFENMTESYYAGLIEFEKGVITTTKEEIIKMVENKL